MSYFKILPLYVLLFFSTASFAQVDYSTWSHDKVLRSQDLKASERYDIMRDRYDKAVLSEDVSEHYKMSKYMARTSYASNRNKEVRFWQSEADSLAKLLKDVPYDKGYEMMRITWAHANKETARAIELLKEMEPKVLASNDTIWMIDYHIKSVLAHCVFDDMAPALKHLLAAENLNASFNGDQQAALLYSARAAVEWENRNIEKSLAYEIKAADIYESIESKGNLESTYSNIIAQGKKLGKNEVVSTYMTKLNQHHVEQGCRKCFFTGELNRVLYKIEIGKYREAISLAEELIILADSTDRDESHAVYLMGVAYRGLDQYDKASALINRAFDLAIELRHNGKAAFYSHALHQTYYWKENYAPALQWYQTHIQYRDSVFNERKLKEIAVYQAKLATLEEKQKVAELEAKVEIDRQKKRILWISLLLGGLLAGAVLYAQRQRSRTEQVRQQALLVQSDLEKRQLEQQLEFKQKELTTQILSMTQKNNLLKSVSTHIADVKSESNSHAISRIIRIINRSLDDSKEWDQFLATFRSIHSSFLERLQSLTENLTPNEVRLASLMKMNLSSKEIATMLNISDDGVKKARYRLRKKLGLASEINIQEYLLSL